MDSPVTQRRSFVIDPQRDGVQSSLWKDVLGAVSVVSNKYRFNSDHSVVMLDMKYGRFEFVVNTPAPAAAQDKEWGLKNLSLGNRGKIFFDITNAVVTVNSYDTAGLNIETTAIQWLAAWNAADTRFVIEWFNDRIVFSYIDSAGVQHILASHKTRVGQAPLNIFFNNANADDFDVAYILAENVQYFQQPLRDQTVTVVGSDIQIGSVEIKNGADDTRMDVETAGADAKNNTANTASVIARLLGFNGTTWDRIRTALTGVLTTLTGILNVLPVVRYNSTEPVLATGNATEAQADKSGRLRVNAPIVSDYIVDDAGNKYQVKRAFVNVAVSQTDSVIVAAVSGKKIRVISVVHQTGATATNLTYNSKPAGAGAAISMLFANGANGGAVLSQNNAGWFETVVNEGLSVTTGAGSATGIQVNYIEV